MIGYLYIALTAFLIPGRLPVLARFRCTVVHAILHHNGLVAAKALKAKSDGVAHLHQFTNHFIVKTRFDADHFLTTNILVTEPGRIAGLLQVHREVDEVHHDLDVALRLHAAAGQSETDVRALRRA